MKVNLLVNIHCIDFSNWKRDAFDKGGNLRKMICDESKTKVAKIDDHAGVIQLFNVELERLQHYLNNPETRSLDDQFEVQQDIYTFSPIH